MFWTRGTLTRIVAGTGVVALAGALSVLAAPASFAAPGPANDNIANATVLAPGTSSIDGTNVGATLEPSEYTPAGGEDKSVWYTWTAATTGLATFDTCTAHSFDTTVAIFKYGDFSPAGLIVANDDACSGLASRVTFDAVAGTSYSIQVNTWSGAAGTFTLSYSVAGQSTPGVPPTKDLTIWMLAVARPTADATCDTGYSPSWARWPNGGTGGWVCVKYTYAYYPNETVK